MAMANETLMLRSRLLQLDQRAVEVLGMQEQYRLAVGADLGLTVAQHARARRPQLVARGMDIGHLVAQVMDASRRAALQEGRDRRSIAERLQQLDLGIGQRDEHDRDTVLGLWDRLRHLRTQRAAVLRYRRPKLRHRNGNMVEPSDHLALLLARKTNIALA